MKTNDWLGVASLIVPQIYASIDAPGLLPAQFADPTYLALVATRVTTVVILGARLAGWSPKFEKLQLALFLAGMPVVYIACALLRGSGLDVGIETLGLGIFGAAAVVGYLRAPWLLAAAIAVHGVGWDAWHHHRSAYVSDWYSMGCLVVDIGFGIYGFLLLPRLAAEDRPVTQPALAPLN